MFFPKRQDEFARKTRAMKPGPETLRGRIKEVLSGADSLEEQQVRLKEFKDREIFLIDPDHILQPEVDFRVLSKGHTLLADRDLFPPPVESMEFTHPPMKNGGGTGGAGRTLNDVEMRFSRVWNAYTTYLVWEQG